MDKQLVMISRQKEGRVIAIAFRPPAEAILDELIPLLMQGGTHVSEVAHDQVAVQLTAIGSDEIAETTVFQPALNCPPSDFAKLAAVTQWRADAKLAKELLSGTA